MISYEKKCIFIHIPRNGGSTVENIIWGPNRGKKHLWMDFSSPFRNKYCTGAMHHLPAKFVRKEVGGEIFDKFFTFTITRNPFDRLVSQYSYMIHPAREGLRDFLNMDIDASFPEYLNLIQKKEHVHWKPQYKFIEKAGKIDYIGRFEEFNKSVRYILDKLEIKLDKIPHFNRSTHNPYRTYYNEKTKKIVKKIYTEDLKRFNYSF